MNFETVARETVILDPANDMARKAIPSEIRRDPLTGRTARICHFMALKWEKPDFDKLVAGTDQWCPFCPDKVLQVTPCFPQEIIPEGRMVQGDKVLFPNIAPYDSLGAVATLGDRHYIPMTEIKPQRIRDAFRLALKFFQQVHQIRHPESVYHLINWNYMPASGSSLIHPHLQVFASSFAPNLMREELDASRIYMETHRTNYWDDFVKIETQNRDRFLGKIGRTNWFSAYAPMGVAGDILAVVDDVVCTLELTDEDLLNIAQGLTRAMTAYDKMGIYNFNMNIFTGAPGDTFTRLHLIFSPRTFFNQTLGTPDIGALRNLYNESLCMAFPEEINKVLKPDFQNAGNY